MFTHHVQSWSSEILETVLRSRVHSIKVMDPDPEPIKRILEQNPNLTVRVRPWIGFGEEQSYWIENHDGAQKLVEKIHQDFYAIRQLIPEGRFYAEAVNEPAERFMWDDSPRYGTFTANFARHAAGYGIIPVGFSFAPGNVPGLGWVGAENPAHRGPYNSFMESLIPQWRWLEEGVAALCEVNIKGKKGAVGLHSYGRDDLRREPSRSFGVLRYRFDNQALQQIGYNCLFDLNEFGLDQGFMGPAAPAELRGFRSIPISPEQYAEQMKEIFQEMLLDKGIVLSVALFSLGHDWLTYSTKMEEPVMQVMAQANSAYSVNLPNTSPNDPPEGAGKMPKETKMGLTYPRVVSEGQTIEVFGSATGVDGSGVLTAKIGLPLPTDGGDELGVGPVKTGIPISPDGFFSFQMVVPEVRMVVPNAFIELTTFELENPDDTTSLDDVTDGAQFVFPLFIRNIDTVVVEPTPTPTPVVEPPIQLPVPTQPIAGTLPYQYDNIYTSAGDINVAATEVSDVTLMDVSLDIHRYIQFLKGEPVANPFFPRK